MIRLGSSNSDVGVELSDIADDYFRIAVLAHDHSATRLVYAYTDARAVAHLFLEAARDWKGWEGSKTWESLEGELRLELVHDGLGHITLTVLISKDLGRPDPWELSAEVTLEAGQLERIAKEVDTWSRGG